MDESLAVLASAASWPAIPVTAGVVTPPVVVSSVPPMSAVTAVGSLASLAANTDASKVIVPSLASWSPMVLALLPPMAEEIELSSWLDSCTSALSPCRVAVAAPAVETV